MSPERDEKEDKAMSDVKKTRRAHKVLDHLGKLPALSKEQEKLLRSFLPELPKQKTLAELCHEVYDAWVGTYENEWPDDVHGELETWLAELRAQLEGVEVTAPAHPEFLVTEADYSAAPVGTVVSRGNKLVWVKRGENDWVCSVSGHGDNNMGLSGRRRVLRWGCVE